MKQGVIECLWSKNIKSWVLQNLQLPVVLFSEMARHLYEPSGVPYWCTGPLGINLVSIAMSIQTKLVRLFGLHTACMVKSSESSCGCRHKEGNQLPAFLCKNCPQTLRITWMEVSILRPQ
jgi:hypothetical protein